MIDTTKIYLCEIGKVPLLTAEEEVFYGQQVQRFEQLSEVRQALTQQLRREATLEEWQQAAKLQREELEQAIALGQRAKHKMIEANLRLVVSIAQRYQKRNIELQDLIQEGNLGLQRGVEKFDPTKGYRFSTYAYWWIRQAITRAIAVKSRAIRIPIHLVEKLNAIKKMQRSLTQKLGRTATIEEVAEALSLKSSEIQMALFANRKLLSLDMPIGENDEGNLNDLLPDKTMGLDERVARSLLRDDLIQLIRILPVNQQQVLILRFGLDDSQPLSLTQVSQRLNCSRETVRLLEKAAMRALKQHKLRLQGYFSA